MQCTVCKNEDQLSNLVTVRREHSEIKDGYAHPRCIEQHNRTAEKNMRALDASMIAGEIFDHDLDATDPYVVKEFLRRGRPQHLLGVRWPTVDEIAKAAEEKRERDDQCWVFDRLEKEVAPWPAEASEAYITEIADQLFGLVRKDEGACGFAARMLALQVAWRKGKEAEDAAYEEYQRSEETAD